MNINLNYSENENHLSIFLSFRFFNELPDDSNWAFKFLAPFVRVLK